MNPPTKSGLKRSQKYRFSLPSDWYLDEVLLLAMPKKDGWGGLADGPWVMEVVVSRWIGEQMQGAL